VNGAVSEGAVHASQADHHLVSAIEQERARKDEFFRLAPDSPIPDEEREAFDGLAYYPVDLAYRLKGLTLGAYAGDEPEAFDMPTSKDDLRQARRAGTVGFELSGRELSLTAYDLGDGGLFVPFFDATNGAETYGGGRYLDLEPEPDGTFTLDFNVAYHPYCVYSPRYSCPLTPAENRLPVRIAAGERLPPS
jgi:uncharacterized protein (DUF1684 family)